MYINLLNDLIVLDVGKNGGYFALSNIIYIDISIEVLFIIALVWLGFSIIDYKEALYVNKH